MEVHGHQRSDRIWYLKKKIYYVVKAGILNA